MQRSILTLFALLLSVELAHAVCTMFGGRAPSRQPGVYRFCPYNSENACCTELEVASVFSEPHIWFNATTECASLIRHTMCHICSSDQADFFVNGVVTLCYSQCVSLYHTCGAARLAEVNDPAHIASTHPAYTMPINKAFTDGVSLCEWLGFSWLQDPADTLISPCYRQFG